jgi:hypothetical protein
MIFKVDDVVRGSMTTSQMSGGRKNGIFLEIYGAQTWQFGLESVRKSFGLVRKNISSELLIKEFAIFTEVDIPTFLSHCDRQRSSDRYPPFEDGFVDC